ncbi:hypothetical protein ACI68E_003466 [Malassezia pachydermatis]|uniref:Uncharacterized protein n=1 Tax=Malassezia pachydermatis TaxID=77020 RepID=A0A0M8MUX9_9BASI|nr:hypothetical protein Malapachy_4254 [Malassezia pachydermatis]KOS14270.1 hypothetical protein Malapachy_4254 [Malassezia pachydermatis]
MTAEKKRDALAHIARTLQSDPSAEELACHQPMLANVKQALDSKKRVSLPSSEGRPRGLPLWIVAKALKSAWHADGSWPVVGYDEAERHRHTCDSRYCILPTLHISMHRHVDVVHNAAYEEGKRQRTILPCQPRPPETWHVEPDADTIARAYEARQS